MTKWHVKSYDRKASGVSEGPWRYPICKEGQIKMPTVDYHVHTKFSLDSTENMEDAVRAALNAGLTEIAFTEHMDLDFPEKYREIFKKEYGDEIYISHPDFDTRPLFTFDIPEYLGAIGNMREKYGEKINILTGFEAGMRPGRSDLAHDYADMKKEHGLDFVLGSLHLLGNEDPYYESVWNGHSADYIVAAYFDELAQCVEENTFFDSLAHMDYVVRYVPEKFLSEPLPEYFMKVPEKNADKIDFILKTIIKRGQALEINTKGLMTGIEHAHPSDGIVARYRELGGTLFTYGSDAHSADAVGKGIVR